MPRLALQRPVGKSMFFALNDAFTKLIGRQRPGRDNRTDAQQAESVILG
jgi:hypothetical protein